MTSHHHTRCSRDLQEGRTTSARSNSTWPVTENSISSDLCSQKESGVQNHQFYLLTRCISMGFPMKEFKKNSVGNSDCPPTAQMEWDTNSQQVQNKCYLLLRSVLGKGCLSLMLSLQSEAISSEAMLTILSISEKHFAPC